MNIKKYTKDDESLLFDLLVDEGDEWSVYHGAQGRDHYIKALESSIVYFAKDETGICGYIRCREDNGFGVYVYDLLVRRTHRGREIGRLLIERLSKDFPEQPTYVMSDVDPYYEKLGYQKIGTIFEKQ
jgi:ribosomal protein S18 acetylase RimI-like enzyme